MIPEIRIRTWAEEDFDALHALDAACFPPHIAYSRRTLRSFLRLAGTECLVAEGATPDCAAAILTLEGQRAGYATSAQLTLGHSAPDLVGERICGFILLHSAGRQGHIVSLDVDSKFRRRGVGSMLLAAAEERMECRGVRHIELETAVDNAAAVSFWRRHEFETIGLLKNYYAHRVDALAMTRNLGESKERRTACTSTKPLSWPSSRA
jgi:ribosomal protein S18 acetylase RimI-like enzyme